MPRNVLLLCTDGHAFAGDNKYKVFALCLSSIISSVALPPAPFSDSSRQITAGQRQGLLAVILRALAFSGIATPANYCATAMETATGPRRQNTVVERAIVFGTEAVGLFPKQVVRFSVFVRAGFANGACSLQKDLLVTDGGFTSAVLGTKIFRPS